MSIYILCFLLSVVILSRRYNLIGGGFVNHNQKDKYRMLGLNIAYYRKLNGYTQEELAEKLNLDRTTISKIELATSGVSLDVIFEISDLFEIPPEKLFRFKD